MLKAFNPMSVRSALMQVVLMGFFLLHDLDPRDIAIVLNCVVAGAEVDIEEILGHNLEFASLAGSPRPSTW